MASGIEEIDVARGNRTLQKLRPDTRQFAFRVGEAGVLAIMPPLRPDFLHDAVRLRKIGDGAIVGRHNRVSRNRTPRSRRGYRIRFPFESREFVGAKAAHTGLHRPADTLQKAPRRHIARGFCEMQIDPWALQFLRLRTDKGEHAMLDTPPERPAAQQYRVDIETILAGLVD